MYRWQSDLCTGLQNQLDRFNSCTVLHFKDAAHMRDDMFKVIVERPRRGHHDKFGDFRNSKRLKKYFDDEAAPGKIGTKRLVRHIRGWDCKDLNENLRPLERFLRSKIGQKWDDVYSEICAKIDSNSTVQNHVLDHLRDYVGVDERYQNGNRFGGRFYYRPDMYVDTNGILRGVDPGPRRQSWQEHQTEELAKKFRKIGNEELWLVNGIWYKPLFKVNDTVFVTDLGVKFYPGTNDIFTNNRVKHGETYRYAKQQADKATLKKFGVENSPQ